MSTNTKTDKDTKTNVTCTVIAGIMWLIAMVWSIYCFRQANRLETEAMTKSTPTYLVGWGMLDKETEDNVPDEKEVVE